MGAGGWAPKGPTAECARACVLVMTRGDGLFCTSIMMSYVCGNSQGRALPGKRGSAAPDDAVSLAEHQGPAHLSCCTRVRVFS